MSLLLHLAAKDARHLRAEAAVWATLVASDTLIFAVGGADGRGWDAASTLGLLSCLLTVLLAARLAQTDSMARTGAFWRTRPIGRSTMAAGKLGLAVAVLAGWPALIDATSAFALGLPVGEALATAGVTLVNQMFLVLPAMAVASFRPDLARFAIAAIASFMAFWLFAWGVRLGPQLAAGLPRPERTPDVYLSSLFVAFVAAPALGAALFWCRHATRRTRRAVGAAVVAAVLLALVPAAWRWDLTRPLPESDVLTESDIAGASLQVIGPLSSRVDSAGSGLVATVWRGARQRLPVLWYGPIRVSGLPAGMFARPVRIHSRAVFDTGTSVTTDRPGTVTAIRPVREPGAAQDVEGLPSTSTTMASALGGVTWLRGPVDSDYQWTPALIALPRTVDRPLVTQHAALEADITLDAYRFEPALSLPLRPGARVAVPGASLEILQVRPWSNYVEPGVVVLVRDRGLRRTEGSWGRGFGAGIGSAFVLINRTRREAIAGGLSLAPQQLRHFGPLLPALVNGVSTLTFAGDRSAEAGATRLTVAWFDLAEVVRLDPVFLGSFTRPLRQVVELPGRLPLGRRR